MSLMVLTGIMYLVAMIMMLLLMHFALHLDRVENAKNAFVMTLGGIVLVTYIGYVTAS